MKIYVIFLDKIFLYVKTLITLHSNSVRNYSEPSFKTHPEFIIVLISFLQILLNCNIIF